MGIGFLSETYTHYSILFNINTPDPEVGKTYSSESSTAKFEPAMNTANSTQYWHVKTLARMYRLLI